MRDVVRTCFVCEKVFSPRSNRQQCCSFECGRIRIRDLPEQREKARLRANEWYKQNRRAVWAKNRKPPVFADCQRCGKNFRKHTRALFCSKDCQYQTWKEKNPDWARKVYPRYKARSNASSLAWHQKTRLSAPWDILITSAKVRAKKKGLPFNLTREWGKKHWTGFCALTGLAFAINPGKGRTLFSPSIDQIVASQGYTQDNCRFILWSVNSLKGAGTDQDVKIIAEAIMRNTRLNPATFLALPG